MSLPNTIREWRAQHWLAACFYAACPISFILCMWLIPTWNPISLIIPAVLCILGSITWFFSWRGIVRELSPLRFRPGRLLIAAIIGTISGYVAPIILFVLTTIQVPLHDTHIFAIIFSVICMLCDIPLQLDQMETRGQSKSDNKA